jgi:hypothetical protein
MPTDQHEEKKGPRALRIGERDAPTQDDSLPGRYGGAVEEGYGTGGGQGPTSADPDSVFAAPGQDAGFAGPRFDRADAGSTGTHGVHPVASSSGLGYQAPGATADGFGSSARSQAILDAGREKKEAEDKQG